tara:strand:- start:7601 stop:8995 length:1395 start_codon:yes stop_codon:yes gene_type:complete
MIKKNIFLKLVFFLCFIPIKAQNKKPPNILIIIADDATYNDLPIHGGVNVKTPEIDKLASEGMTFNKAYLTMSMCTPSRAEFFTGLYPVSNGVNWNHGVAKKEVKSIVHYLGEEGYKVGLAGKIHVKPKEVFPFELINGIERNPVSKTAKFDVEHIRHFMTTPSTKPFCLVSALVVPHIPWTVGDPSHFNPEKIELPSYLADTPETRKEFINYLAEVEVLDQQVGSILEVLREENLANDTIVIFTSEHGAQFPFSKWTNYEMGIHTSLIVRWPKKVKPNSRSDAIIQYVDVLPTIIDAVNGNSDQKFDGSSFLSVLKGKKNTHRNFVYFMHNNVPEGPSYPIRSVSDGEYHYIRNLKADKLFIEKHLMTRMPLNKYWPSWVFASTENKDIMKLVNRYMKRPSEELYHLETDPNELNNLIKKSSLKSIQRHLSNQLDLWMKSQGDLGIELDFYEAFNRTTETKDN